MIDFENAALIVSHLDDELLFFSSVIEKVKHIYFCFGPTIGKDSELINVGREHIYNNYPRQNCTFYKLLSSKASYIDYPTVDISFYGVNLDNASTDLSLEYYKNYLTLYSILDNEIPKYSTILTHNPWGEYYHAEHIQVNKLVTDICLNHNKTLIFDSYIASGMIDVAQQMIDDTVVQCDQFDIDESLINQYYGMYRDNNCWTFFNDHKWHTAESLLTYGISKTPTKYRLNSI